MGGQIAWLLPAAVIFLVALLWLSRRSLRTDGRRAALVLWGGWLLVTAATFSFAQGIIHPYYNVVLAPAIGALVGIGAASLWPHRRLLYVRGLLIVAIAATGLCSLVLLSRSPNWQPWLRPTVLALALVSATAIAVGQWIPRRLAAILAATAATAAIVGGLAGPAAYSVQTAATAATGAIPAAGPAAGMAPVAAVAAVCTEYAAGPASPPTMAAVADVAARMAASRRGIHWPTAMAVALTSASASTVGRSHGCQFGLRLSSTREHKPVAAMATISNPRT